MARLLLAEDDLAISEPLTRAFEREGYEVTVAATGAAALLHCPQVDVVVLDLGLPDMDGLDVARAVRQQELVIPIIILTARSEEVDLVVGLDAGADDYVTKPFRLAELMARVRALLRRAKAADSDPIELELQNVRLDLINRKAYRDGHEVHLTVREFDILRHLMSAPGETVSRDMLMEAVWGTEVPHTSKTMDMHISWLRRKLATSEDEPIDKYISTVRGAGFRFETGE